MSKVAQILVKAFYEPSRLLQHFHNLKELDRLQSNFPYSDPNHFMFVAESKCDQQIVGCVDIDMRKSILKNAPPRPYLSDLAVHEKWRRKGIARDLILKCEKTALEANKKTLYLRVESANEVALRMYFGLGYSWQQSKIFGVLDTTMLLRRDLETPRPGSGNLDVKLEGASNVESPVLDYVV